MSKPLVSFIIPTYNALPELKECLESIQKQNYPKEHFEIIVIDGGSTDGTSQLAKQLGVQVINNPRRVAEHGKNIGLQAARGKFIALLDADNVIASPDWLSKIVKTLKSNPKLFGVESSYYPHPNYSALNRYLTTLHIADPFAYVLAKLSQTKPVGANGFVWRKEMIERFHDFKEPFLEADLAARIQQETNYEYLRLVDAGIYHFHVDDWQDFIKKRYKIARKFLNRAPQKGHTWAYSPQSRLSFLLAVFYCGTFVGPLLEGIYRTLWERKLFWLLHPWACLMTVIIYGLTFLRHLIFPFSVPGEIPRKFILSHYSSLKGAIDHYEDFLLQQGQEVTHPSLPLAPYKTQSSSGHGWILLFKNLFQDLWQSLRKISGTNIKTFTGADNFDTFIGILARRLRLQKIPRIIYFSSDFARQRFKNRLLNQLYLLAEKLAARNADLTVSKTRRAARERIKLGLAPEKSLVIPNGVSLKNPRFKPKAINPHHVIYAGQVNPEHGLLGFLEEMEDWIEELVVIGKGPNWQKLKSVVAETDYKSRLYHQRDHDFVIQKLQDFNGFGLAPYSLDPELRYHTYYGSSLKVKEYISCGLPVVLADVLEITQKIRTQGLGVVYSKLDAPKITPQIKNFDVSSFHLKAKVFYNENQWEKLLQPLAK